MGLLRPGTAKSEAISSAILSFLHYSILSPRSFCEWHLRHSSTFHFLLVTSGVSSLVSRFSTTLFITSTRSLSSLSFWVSLLISWLALERRSARPLSRLDVRVLLLQAITLRKAE